MLRQRSIVGIPIAFEAIGAAGLQAERLASQLPH